MHPAVIWSINRGRDIRLRRGNGMTSLVARTPAGMVMRDVSRDEAANQSRG
jgi:hypothetical protein